MAPLRVHTGMTFPDQKFDDIGAYADAYFNEWQKAGASVDRIQLVRAAAVLAALHESGGTLWVCGNGGSAAISNHLICDHGKLLSQDTDLTPHVHSLVANVPVITAIANDLEYAEVFVHQLRMDAKEGDVLVTVSSSGDSENVVRAAAWARDQGLEVIAMTGFAGGRSAGLATVNLHVDADNYGVIEDTHQALMHMLGQFLRQSRMDETKIQGRKF